MPDSDGIFQSEIDDPNHLDSVANFENHQNPQIRTGEKKYHTLLPRALALMIDGMIISIVTYPLLLIQQESQLISLFSSLLPIAYLTIAIYKFGTTAGKHLFKIKVVSFPSESSVTFTNALLRNSFEILSLPLVVVPIFSMRVYYSIMPVVFWTIGILSVLDVLFTIFSDNRRSLHDRIAQTVCIINSRGDA